MDQTTASPAHALQTALLDMDRIQAKTILDDYGNAHGPNQLVEVVITPAMEAIGDGWQRGELALSQVYMSSRICAELAERIVWSADKIPAPQPKMAAVVLEDYHMLGRQMVYSALRAAGYEVIDYGRMDVETLTERVVAEEIELLLISTLMLRAALRIEPLHRQLRARGSTVKLLVGGAPFRFDDQLHQQVGADAVGHTIADALRGVRSFS